MDETIRFYYTEPLVSSYCN